MEEFKRKHGEDIAADKRAVQLLRTACENMKCRLSMTDTTEYIISSILSVEDFQMVIERSTFEELCKDICSRDLFDLTLTIVKKGLKDADLNETQIDGLQFEGAV